MHASRMSKEELVSKLATTWRNESTLMAETIALLIEIEAKNVHLELACPSMFEFCMRHFGMSEGEAYRRTAVARIAGKFPAILAALREKRVHLTTLAKMRKLFTLQNVDELLKAVAGKRKHAVDEVIARYAPKPDVPSRIRRLPARRKTATAPAPVPMTVPTSPAPTPTPAELVSIASSTDAPRLTHASERTLDLFASPPRPATVTPLAESRYAVQFTASAELRDVIEEAKSLMRHRHPDGDLAAIAMEAFSDLVAKLKKAKFAAFSKKPRRAEPPARSVTPVAATAAVPVAEAAAGSNSNGGAGAAGAGAAAAAAAANSNAGAGAAAVAQAAEAANADAVSAGRAGSNTAGGAAGAGGNKRRRVPNAVKREVVARDGLQCTYVGPNRERCPARERLEIDHRRPHALGGGNEASNLRLLCRAHNQYAAEAVFGRAHMVRAIEQRKQPRREEASDAFPPGDLHLPEHD